MDWDDNTNTVVIKTRRLKNVHKERQVINLCKNNPSPLDKTAVIYYNTN
ncbi:MAG: hypothetical protein IJI39_05005 [Clostridia bacterium]|nr:hypothetical protein [Clostridia bacterium]